jgi:hypothetical protein
MIEKAEPLILGAQTDPMKTDSRAVERHVFYRRR